MLPPAQTCRLQLALAFIAAVTAISLGADNKITFHKQTSQPGHRMVQRSFVHVDTIQSYEQSNQLISKTNREVRKTQVRKIKTVSTTPAVVQVTYAEAHLQEGKNRLFAKKKPEPVQHKSYEVTRDGEELRVVNADGSVPPRAEVQSTMSWVGRPNEIAEFLNGRTVAVHEQIDLPEKVAAKMFGGNLGMGRIESAALELEKIKNINGAKCGVFTVALIGHPATSPNEPAGQPLNVRGKVYVQADTCRTALVQVDSDLDLSEQRGPAGAQFTVKNRGKIHIAINASFGEAL